MAMISILVVGGCALPSDPALMAQPGEATARNLIGLGGARTTAVPMQRGDGTQRWIVMCDEYGFSACEARAEHLCPGGHVVLTKNSNASGTRSVGAEGANGPIASGTRTIGAEGANDPIVTTEYQRSMNIECNSDRPPADGAKRAVPFESAVPGGPSGEGSDAAAGSRRPLSPP